MSSCACHNRLGRSDRLIHTVCKPLLTPSKARLRGTSLTSFRSRPAGGGTMSRVRDAKRAVQRVQAGFDALAELARCELPAGRDVVGLESKRLRRLDIRWAARAGPPGNRHVTGSAAAPPVQRSRLTNLLHDTTARPVATIGCEEPVCPAMARDARRHAGRVRSYHAPVPPGRRSINLIYAVLCFSSSSKA